MRAAMIEPGLAAPLELGGLTPKDVLARWPAERQLATLVSVPGCGAGTQGSRASVARERRWSRWSIFAEPGDRVIDDLAALGRGALPGAHAAHRAMRAPSGGHAGDELPPFVGGWIGSISYEAGYDLEPAAARASSSNGSSAREPLSRQGSVLLGEAWPRVQFRRCDAALVHDAVTGRWWAVGDARQRAELLEIAESCAGEHRADGSFMIGPLQSGMGRSAYEAAVARTIGYIRAGDIFQANIAHALSGSFEGEPRAFFQALLERAAPWYGAYLDVTSGRVAAAEVGEVRDGAGRRALCSVSPELFLEVDAAARRVTTRPIKGTRHGPRAASELAANTKDIAELVMIVDLMRNDLGRVCEFGSVRVEEARTVEAHAGGQLHHGVSTVSGTLREGATLADLLRATFPPGSVTGAPKIRAMQIIRELEPTPRGPYCGCIGYISDSGDAAFSVAIRTALVEQGVGGAGGAGGAGGERNDGRVSYSVGAGIVADSEPGAEWAESLDKAEAFVDVARRSRGRRASTAEQIT